MVLANVKLQEVLCGEISAAIGASMCMYLGIMDLELLVGGK